MKLADALINKLRNQIILSILRKGKRFFRRMLLVLDFLTEYRSAKMRKIEKNLRPETTIGYNSRCNSFIEKLLKLFTDK